MKNTGRIIQMKRNNTEDVAIRGKADVGGGYIYHSARRLSKDKRGKYASQVLEDQDLMSTGTVPRSQAQESLTRPNKKDKHQRKSNQLSKQPCGIILNKNRNAAKRLYLTDEKALPRHMSQNIIENPIEQESASWVEYPPIPQHKRYRADVRSCLSSASTENMAKVKFRKQRHHPEQGSSNYAGPSEEEKNMFNRNKHSRDLMTYHQENDVQPHHMPSKKQMSFLRQVSTTRQSQQESPDKVQNEQILRSEFSHNNSSIKDQPRQSILNQSQTDFDKVLEQKLIKTDVDKLSQINQSQPESRETEITTHQANQDYANNGTPLLRTEIDDNIQRKCHVKVQNQNNHQAQQQLREEENSLNQSSEGIQQQRFQEARANATGGMQKSLGANQLALTNSSHTLQASSKGGIRYQIEDDEPIQKGLDAFKELDLYVELPKDQSIKASEEEVLDDTYNQEQQSFIHQNHNSKLEVTNQDEELIKKEQEQSIFGQELAAKLVNQALIKCYSITSSQAQQLVSDVKEQINHYRNQTTVQAISRINKRIIIGPDESSNLFNNLADRFYLKGQEILENNCDLRPILNLILLCMQDYQDEKTQIDALKCINFLSKMENCKFRSKIWHWVKYTSIKQAKEPNQQLSDSEWKQHLVQLKQAHVYVHGFIQTVCDLMSKHESSAEVKMLACRILLIIAQKSLASLFYEQLPNLSMDRLVFLKMINEHFQVYSVVLTDLEDDVKRVPLIKDFIHQGIPEFLIAQSLLLLHDKQPEHLSNESKQVAICLITEIWNTMPQLYKCQKEWTQSGMNQIQNLEQLTYSEQEDFGLEIKLSQTMTLKSRGQKTKSLGFKVLSLIKQACQECSITVKLTLISRIFAVFDSLRLQDDMLSDTIYSFVIYLLVEWHQNETLRSSLLTNLTQILKQDKDLSLSQLVGPLFTIIRTNMDQESASQDESWCYLSMDDFSFFWELANMKQISIESALQICQLMQDPYMIKKESQYRAVADKIFFKLITTFAECNEMKQFLKNHTAKILTQLDQLDKIVNENNSRWQMSASDIGSEMSSINELEMQIQKRYLKTHLLSFTQTGNEAANFGSQLEDHIVNMIQNKLQLNPQDMKSNIWKSMLTKIGRIDVLEALNKQKDSLDELNSEQNNNHNLDEANPGRNGNSPALNMIGVSKSEKDLLGAKSQNEDIKPIKIKRQAVKSQENLIEQPLVKEGKLRSSDSQVDRQTSTEEFSLTNNQEIKDRPSTVEMQDMGTDYDPPQVKQATPSVTDHKDQSDQVQLVLTDQAIQTSPKEVNNKPQVQIKPSSPKPIVKAETTSQTRSQNVLSFEDKSGKNNTVKSNKRSFSPLSPINRGSNKNQQLIKIPNSPIIEIEGEDQQSSAAQQSAQKATSHLDQSQQSWRSTPKPSQFEEPKMIKILPEIQVEEEDSPLLLNFKQTGNNRDMNKLDLSEKAQEPNADIMNALNKIMTNLDGIKEKVEENESDRQERILERPKEDDTLPSFQVQKITKNSFEDFYPQTNTHLNSMFSPISQNEEQLMHANNEFNVKLNFESPNLVVDDLEQKVQLSSRRHSRNSNTSSPNTKTRSYIQKNTSISFPKEVDVKLQRLTGARLKATRNLMTELDIRDFHHNSVKIDKLLSSGDKAKIVQINKTPTSVTYNKLPPILAKTSEVQAKARTLRLSSSQDKLMENCGTVGSQLSVHQYSNTPRKSTSFKGLPIKLPQVKDFWKYKKVGQTQFGDSINMQWHQTQRPRFTQILSSTKDVDSVNSYRSQIKSPESSIKKLIRTANTSSLGDINDKFRRLREQQQRLVLRDAKEDAANKNTINPRSVVLENMLAKELEGLQNFRRRSVNILKDNKSQDDLLKGNGTKLTQSKVVCIERGVGDSDYKLDSNKDNTYSQHSKVDRLKVVDNADSNSLNEVNTSYVSDNKRGKTNALTQDMQQNNDEQQPNVIMIDLSFEAKKPSFDENSGMINPTPDKQQEDEKEEQNIIDSNHPGFQNLTDLEQDQFISLQSRDFDSFTPEEREKYNKLISEIINGKPLDLTHPGVDNLSPKEVEELQNLLEQKRQGSPLSQDQKQQLTKLQEKLRDGIPLDERHPGLVNLTPRQQESLQKLSQLKKNGQPLTNEQAKELDCLKNQLVHGKPLDTSHPGRVNLNPRQLQTLQEILNKRNNNEPLLEKEKRVLQNLQNLMLNGKALDQNHPGFRRLRPNDQMTFSALKSKSFLTPEEMQTLNRLAAKMQINSGPLDMSHEGVHNLDEADKDLLKNLLQKEASNQKLSPQEQQELSRIRDIMRPYILYDRYHPGFERLSHFEKQRLQDINDKLARGQELSPNEKAEHTRIKQIMNDPCYAFDENHPGWNNLDPEQQRRIKELLNKENNGNLLTPEEEDELETLKGIMLNGSLKHQPMKLHEKQISEEIDNGPSLRKSEMEQFEGLLNLSLQRGRTLTIVKEESEPGISPHEKALIDRYLKMKVFQDPMSEEQEQELNNLLMKDKYVNGNINNSLSSDEEQRLKELVEKKYHSDYLEPEEEKELNYLHGKQNKDRGALSPRNLKELQDLKNKQQSGQELSAEELEKMQRYLDMQALPSALLDWQEEELREMERKNRVNDISPQMKTRLRAFWRIKYHPQLMNLEEIAMLYLMRDLECLTDLSEEQDDLLYAIRRKFNCLPYITPEQKEYLNKLKLQIGTGNALSVRDTKIYNKLKHLPEREEDESLQPMITPSRTLKQNKSTLPVARRLSQSSLQVPSKKNEARSIANDSVSFISTRGGLERKAMQVAFKRAIRKGTLTIKQLIDQFYDYEKTYVIADYLEKIKKSYQDAKQMSKATKKEESKLQVTRNTEGREPLVMKDFLKYAVSKKIRFKQNEIHAILSGDSQPDNISLESFIKLFILASCAGDRTKIGIRNFQKLMKHMDYDKKK